MANNQGSAPATQTVPEEKPNMTAKCLRCKGAAAPLYRDGKWTGEYGCTENGCDWSGPIVASKCSQFDPERCPKCGELPRGTLETLSGVAEFAPRQDGVRENGNHDDPERDVHGNFTYSGNTEIFWDGQMTQKTDGNPHLICWNGHDWPAKDRETQENLKETRDEGGKRVWIEDLAERGGALDVSLRAIVIDVKEGSGLVFRCPDCKRVLRKMTCRVHGQVQGVADLRVKVVVDDGSGALIAVIGRALAEGLLDKTLEKCVEEAKARFNQDVIREELIERLVANPVEVRGDVTMDDYGLMMVVESMKILKVQTEPETVEEEARAEQEVRS